MLGGFGQRRRHRLIQAGGRRFSSGVIREPSRIRRIRTLSGVNSNTSRAELALSELCSKLGYCLSPDDEEAILADPPLTQEAFVDAVLVAEGRDPSVILKQDRRPLLSIVDKWAVYKDEGESASFAERPRFPSDR